MLIYLQMIESEEDKAKFEQIYTDYRQLMYATAYNILKNSADAEDAVHQAFVSIIENLHKFHKMSCLETKRYVVVITKRKAIDILRQRKRVFPEELIEKLADVETALPIDGGLADAIAKLPAQYRQVILLHYGYGYSMKEMGAMLGKSSGAVQRQIWRAKDALQKQLDKMGVAIWTDSEKQKREKGTTASATTS